MLYEIESKAGHIIGYYHGNNEAEALLSMLRDAGASKGDVWLAEDGKELEHYDEDARSRLGNVSDYYITKYQPTV